MDGGVVEEAWIPDQVRDDILGVRDEILGLRDQYLGPWCVRLWGEMNLLKNSNFSLYFFNCSQQLTVFQQGVVKLKLHCCVV
jgi:hypothetical protein